MEDKMEDANFFPTASDLLKAGAQFGHEKSRWNPKMAKYIFGVKNGIHVIDSTKTLENLEKAHTFLKDAASRGNILFVGTKMQASQIIKDEAIRAGAFFVTNRWAGGLFTNFNMIKQSLAKLLDLEKQFEEGVQGRTKYEVALMKKEWQSLTRLYGGIKALTAKPTAVVVLDTKFEKAAVREARKVGIPVIGIVDTNCDPEVADYVIPANDDALNAIKMIFRTLGNAVMSGNGGNGIKHELKDYAKQEVKITKAEETDSLEVERVSLEGVVEEETSRTVRAVAEKPVKSTSKAKGILERVKEEAEVKKTKVETKEVVAKAETVKEKAPKAAKKVEEKDAKKVVKAKAKK